VGGGWGNDMSGSNSFVGELFVYGDSVVSGSNTGITKITVQGYESHRKDFSLGSSNALAPSGAASHPVMYFGGNSSTVFHMNSRSQTLGGLSGSRHVDGLGALTLNVGTGESYTWGGTISGTGTLTKRGEGTQVLSSATGLTYSGNTNVTEGTLRVTGTLINSTAVVSGGTLEGDGTLAGGLQVTGSGHVAPGLSVGTLNTANLSFAGDSVLDAEISPTGNDVLNVTGTVSIADNATLDVSGSLFYLGEDDLFFLIVNDDIDPITGMFANAPQGGRIGLFDGLGGYVSYFGDSVAGTITGGNDLVLYDVGLVPEPAGVGLMGLALLGLRKRRKWSRDQ
jgi:autotransporter-associated beta strand protein